MLVWVLVCACVRVCVHKHALCKMGQGFGREKGPHLISSSTAPPPASRLCLQIGFYITEAVRYEQLIFLSLFLPFLSFIPLSYSRFILSISFVLPFFFFFLLSVFPPLPHAGTVNAVLSFLRVSRADSVSGSVNSAVAVWLVTVLCD